MDILDKLNPQQKEAVVNTDGPILVLSGAGSGKTRVLTHKTAYLLQAKKVKPWEILAVTFTNKAAGEMKSRIENIMQGDIGQLWVGTFHALFARILRRHSDKFGYKPTFAIYDREDQLKVVKEVLDGFPTKEELSPKRALGLISSIKSSLRPKQEKNQGLFGRINIEAVYEGYEKKLRAYGAFDFDDLLVKPLELFRKNPEIVNIYRERFRYILVDEFQDTNTVQNELLKALYSTHKNITVVGDDDQSIYGWRGAEITNILDFEKNFPGAKIFRLERNYRSSKPILAAAQAVIKHNQGRHRKELWTEIEGKHKPVLLSSYDEREEAHSIAGIVEDAVEQGMKRDEIAILYRTNAQSRSLEGAFRERNIPYTIVGGLKFYQRKEIKDALAYLRVLLNPEDGVSLLRIINFPPRGIGDKTISAASEFADANNINLWQALQRVDEAGDIKQATAAKLKRFMGVMDNLRKDMQTLEFPDLVQSILKNTGMMDYYIKEGDEEALARADNLEEFASGVEEYCENYPERTIDDFLQEAALASDTDEWEEGELVSLMTVHSAKGLEFRMVFIAGLEDGLFPLMRDGDADIEEERRLFYVAATRAMEKLYLSYASRRREGMYSPLSRFVEEIPGELLGEGSKRGRRNTVMFEEKAESQAHRMSGANKAMRSAGAFTSSPLQASGPQFRKGDNVEHSKFGMGTVYSSEMRSGEEIVTVYFQGYGAKQLMVRLAGLRKIRN